jgi:hypothetical protein
MGKIYNKYKKHNKKIQRNNYKKIETLKRD